MIIRRIRFKIAVSAAGTDGRASRVRKAHSTVGNRSKAHNRVDVTFLYDAANTARALEGINDLGKFINKKNCINTEKGLEVNLSVDDIKIDKLDLSIDHINSSLSALDEI